MSPVDNMYMDLIFLLLFDHLCLLIGLFNPFTFNVTVDMHGFSSSIYFLFPICLMSFLFFLSHTVFFFIWWIFSRVTILSDNYFLILFWVIFLIIAIRLIYQNLLQLYSNLIALRYRNFTYVGLFLFPFFMLLLLYIVCLYTVCYRLNNYYFI